MATKKITELPLIQTISGSFSVVPIVIGNTAGNGTTDQITIENFSRFVTAYSAHTGSAGNTFTGPQIINSNVTINGRLTVTEVVAQYETASVIFSSGSNIFGDKWDDVHTFTGSVIYNGVILTNIDANTIQKLQQATASIELASASFKYFYQSTASLQTFTASQADRNLVLSTVTGSINQATASIQFQTASLLAFTASQDSRNLTLSQVTGSFNYFYQATASIQFQTASLLAFTASQDSRNLTLSQVTGSFRGEIGGLEAYTASLKNSTLVSSSAQIFAGYDYEIHVSQVDGNDTTGNGDLLTPVATIAKALLIVSSSYLSTDRRTIIIHPGTYTESPTVTLANTYIFAPGLLGANTAIAGTLTINAACRISGIKMTNLVVNTTSAVYINNTTVDTQMTVTNTGYLETTDCSFQCPSGVTVSGAAPAVIFNTTTLWGLVVSNASAVVIVRNSPQVLVATVTAGNLALSNTLLFSSTPTGNAITTSANSIVTLSNLNILIPSGLNVARVSLSGFYSIIDVVYDKPNSTLVALSGTGGSLNSIDYFQYINADKFITQGGTDYQFLKGDGSLDSKMPSSLQQTTASLNTYTGSNDSVVARILQTTASLNTFTASQDSRNFTLSQVTGSLIGITNGLMAFTASLDNTYATDAQLYQLYQATASLQFQTASLLIFTASEDSRNFTLSQVTGSFRGEIGGLEAYTASLKGAAIVSSSTQVQNYDVFALNSKLYTVTGSLIGITNGLMAFTAALDNTYATDAQLYQLYQATRSIELTTGSLIGIDSGLMAYTASLKAAAIVSSSTQVQNYDIFALNSNLYSGTGSIKGEIAGIEAYTASLKGAAIVSSSQQVQNYFTFAKTGSANTFYSANNFYNPLLISANTGVATAVPLSLLEVYDGVQSIYKADSGVGTTGAGIWLSHYTLTRANLSGSGIFSLRDNGDSNYHGLAFKIHNTATATDPAVTALSIASGGDVTVSIGNLVMASGKGIDFSATANSGSTVTSEILNDYEAGTWTPTDASGASLTFTTVLGRYIKIGKQVTVHFRVTYPSTVSGATAILGGLPYLVESSANNFMGGVVHWNDASMDLTLMVLDTTSTSAIRRNVDNLDVTNTLLSTKTIRGTVVYETYS